METPPTFVRTPHLERPDATNWSTLKTIGTSPKHYLHALDNPRPQTDALLLGSVTHCLVFEPGEFGDRYIAEPRLHRGQLDQTARGNGYEGGKQMAAEFDLDVATRRNRTGGPVIVVKPDMLACARAMCQAVQSDPVAGPIVFSGWSERKIEWTDAETGIACRGTVDHVNGCLFDFKTTRSLATFERDCVRFGYHAQLPWYFDGCCTSGISFAGQPGLIAVESVPPHDVLVLTFTPDDLAVGRRVYRRCLDRLAECRRTGLWPGVSNGVARRVVLPPWADPIMEDMEVVIDGNAVAL